MEYQYQDYLKMKEAIEKRTSFKPRIGIVLGSGLGDFVSQVNLKTCIPYAEIPSMPVATNKAHKGQFVLGTIQDIPLILMQGRLHRYEGYSSQEVVIPIRLMGMLGIKSLILTNTAGGITGKPGDILLLKDQIACLIESPLRGENMEEFGPRFPDMSNVYDEKATNQLFQKALKESLPVKEGIYMQFNGPQYESKAEIQMAKILKADCVGMSTAIEAIASAHMGIKTLGISLITNYAAGLSPEKLSDEDVVKTAKKSASDMTKILNLALEVLAYGE